MYHIDENGHIANEDGWIFLRYFQPMQRYVKVGNHEYVFVPRNNVAGAWIAPEDVDRVLNMTKECCGGKHSAAFGYVNEENTRLWLGLGR